MYRRSIHVGEPLTVDIHADEHITPDGRVRRILLLEDRSDYRQVLQDHLAYSGYKVTPVHSGIEGLREIMAGPFDVIICDMLMPRMGGEMFYWAVTRVRPGTRERFIFFTGHKTNPRIEFFFRRINAKVLFKPFRLATLDSAVRDVLLKAG